MTKVTIAISIFFIFYALFHCRFVSSEEVISVFGPELNSSSIDGSRTLLDLMLESEQLMQEEMEALNRYKYLMDHLDLFKKVDDSKYFTKLRHMIAGADSSFLSSKSIDQLRDVVFPNEPWLECLFKGLRNLRSHIEKSAAARAQSMSDLKNMDNKNDGGGSVKRSVFYSPRIGRHF